MKVSNVLSSRGNKIANQFIIHDEEKGNRFFQSYKSTIVKIDNKGVVYLDVYYWDYSNTTSKYRNLFLGETKKETEKKIKDGVYKLINLNK